MESSENGWRNIPSGGGSGRSRGVTGEGVLDGLDDASHVDDVSCNGLKRFAT